ncbi:hypothetical protein [Bacillus wiedmannii]|uniref:hypothetical protein n=1 Tax=Bacillus wiedmannii TaxID=1890302 RepID=UPI001F0A4AA8|nr:hypothetical protein [Bacillus wiedmannii]
MDSNKFCPNFVELPPVTFPGVPGISLVASPVPLTKNIKEERGIHYKLLVEERKRSDRREIELFINLEKNTEQLEGIATTL